MPEPSDCSDGASPARSLFAVVPHDTNALPRLPKALLIGAAGTLTLRAVDDMQDVALAVVAGQFVPVRASHVRATGTTAGQIVALACSGAPAPALNPPVLSDLTNGWSTGDNPPDWNTAYDGIYYNGDPDDAGFGEGDQLRVRWRLGGGAWNTEAWLPYDTELVLEGFHGAYDFFTDGSLAAGGAFDAYVEAIRDLGLPGESAVVSSNQWTDEIAALPSGVDIAVLGNAQLPFGFGHDPISSAAIPCEPGDKLLIALLIEYNTGSSVAVTAVDHQANAIALTQIGVTASSGQERLYLYRADATSAESVTVTVDPNDSTREGILLVSAVRGAAAGAPVASHFEKRPVTNEDPHDVDGGVALPTNGRVLVFIGVDGSGGNHSYSGATKIADVTSTSGNNCRLSLAVQNSAGGIALAGQNSGGVGYGNLAIAVTSWSPA